MKEITIMAPNRVGLLADIAETLGNHGVNIEAISGYECKGDAIIRVLTNDVSTALKHLKRIPSIEVKESEILVLELQNRPGELGKITRKLSNKGIDIETVYIVSHKGDKVGVAIKPSTEQLEKAKEVLGVKG